MHDVPGLWRGWPPGRLGLISVGKGGVEVGKVHLERVVVVGGDAQYLGVQRSGRQTCVRVNQKLYDHFIHF